MKISRQYAGHRAELRTILGYISGDNGAPTPAAIRLGILQAEIDNLRDLRAAFDVAFAAYRDPDLHTSVAVREMKIADARAFAAILPLRRRLKNGTAALTAEDYANLGIHEDKKTRTRAKRPADVPFAILVHSAELVLTFEAIDETADGRRRFVLPRGWRIAREIAVLPQGAAAAEGDFRAIDTVGRSRFSVSFVAADVGMNVYLRAAYENTAGRGPFSLPIKAVVI
ncbi:MAG: hypothetical protein ACR2QC_09535 [Gammaproteobacteria bacterium]